MRNNFFLPPEKWNLHVASKILQKAFDNVTRMCLDVACKILQKAVDNTKNGTWMLHLRFYKRLLIKMRSCMLHVGWRMWRGCCCCVKQEVVCRMEDVERVFAFNRNEFQRC